LVQYTKWLQNYRRHHKIYPNVVKYSKWPDRYTNIFNSKVLQSIPNLGFLVWKETIWQPWASSEGGFVWPTSKYSVYRLIKIQAFDDWRKKTGMKSFLLSTLEFVRTNFVLPELDSTHNVTSTVNCFVYYKFVRAFVRNTNVFCSLTRMFILFHTNRIHACRTNANYNKVGFSGNILQDPEKT
jgi:hypothetical protein